MVGDQGSRFVYSSFGLEHGWGKAVAFILYLVTAILTATPVWYALGWAVWGAPIFITEYVSLAGSLLLAFSAFVSLAERRIAGRIALVGLLAIWSLYLPAITGLVRVKLNDQRLTLYVLKWMPSSEQLTVSNLTGNLQPDTRLTEADIELLKEAGVKGTVTKYSMGRYGNGTKSSRAIIVMQSPISVPVELPEPNATMVVYFQHGNTWQKHPANAPTLKRTIRIEPLHDDPKQSSVMVELSSGARQGFGVWWPKSELR
jgi:hypothetical protein